MNNLNDKLRELVTKYRNLADSYSAGQTDDDPTYDNGREIGTRVTYEVVADELETLLKDAP